MKPLISVIIPTHNNEATIGRALESICTQTYKELEIIVVDDHCTDHTRDVVAAFSAQDSRITYVSLAEEDPERFDAKLQRNVNAGYSARNRGFGEATGSYITFQDADDASLRNRIELQYELLQKYNATHLCLDYMPLDEAYLGKTLDEKRYIAAHQDIVIGPEELYRLSQHTKGLAAKLSCSLNAIIPFHIKRLRVLHHLFFGSLAPYPGAGNSPLFSRTVLERVRFRKLHDRTWPSFMGRGADRDFNFQVAETYRNSYVVRIPAYLWDNRSNDSAPDLKPYLT